MLEQSGPVRRMKILVVDDHVLIRDAVRGALLEVEHDASILEASACAETMRLVEEHADLALVILDLKLPDGDGLSVLAELRVHHPALSIIVLSAFDDRDRVVKALRLGAQGFIPKTAKRDIMLNAFRLVLSGGLYIPPEIFDWMAVGNSLSTPAVVPSVSPAGLGLTERQIEVLALMMQGKSNKAICRALNLAEPTVKNHVTAILRALKVSNRTAAVIAAGKLGLIRVGAR